MAKFRVLITSPRLSPGDKSVQILEEAGCEPVFAYWHGGRNEDELIDILKDIDAAVAATDPFTARVLQSCPRLKVVSRTGVGYDEVDVDAATSQGIAVCTTPGVNRHAVADFTMASILQCARRMTENFSYVPNGKWTRYEGRDLAGSTLGVIGFGTIGQEVAQRARGFEMQVLAYDVYQDPVFAESKQVTYVPLEQLLKESDYVTLHVFLDSNSRYMIDADRLAMMKPSAYLINTSRGPVVDTTALCDALKAKSIAGAVLDVFEEEPLAKDSPLLGLDNVFLSAHTAGSTMDSRIGISEMAARNAALILNGERPLAILNPQVLKRS